MNVSYNFTDRIALITGAGSGIGRATALAFAGAGAIVIAAGKSQPGIDETIKLVAAAGGRGTGVYVDIRNRDAVQAMIDRIVQNYGRLDIAHNNAGIFPTPQPFADLDHTTWDDTIAINLTGVFNCLQAEINAMRPTKRGVIINTASNIGAHSRRPGLAAYIASKAAVTALTAAAALDHIGDGIRINAVSPGAVATRMSLRPGESEEDRANRLAQFVPIGRVGQVEEIVNAVLWLASDASSFVVGQDLVVDGGMTA